MKLITKIINTIAAVFLSLLVIVGFGFIAFLVSMNNPFWINLSISGLITLIGLFLAYKVFKVFYKIGLVNAWSFLIRAPEYDDNETKI